MALLKEQRGTLILGLVCVLGGALLDLAPAAFIKWAVDAIADGNTYQAGMMAIWIVTLYSVKYFFTRGQMLFLNMAAHRVTANLRLQLFRKLQSLPIAYFNTARTGAIQSVITNDVAVIQTGVPLVKDVMSAPVRLMGGVFLLLYLNWRLALISVAILPIIAFAIVRTSKRVRQSQKEVQENLSDMTATMQESLNAVRIVRAFSAEERQSSRFANDIEATYHSNMKVVNRMASLKPLIEVIGACAIAVIMYLGARFVAAGNMTAGDLFSFVYLLDVIKNGATGIGNISSVYSQVAAATDHIYKEVFDVETDVPDDEDAQTIESPSGRIVFDNVSFSYPDGTPALHNVSFVIEPGETVALVGRSGAGKSTIADLLLRFYDPTEGSITFDGVDLRRLDSKWLRKQVGVVPQQTLLFSGSLLDNIRFGKPEATSDEVRAAAYASHADEFISEMPDGYHTFVGEKGVRLSGGEMQRIAIARALIIDPRIMLLDEATSALDSISEKHVQTALEDVTKDRATLLIAHRLSTAANADRIIVLSRGKIVEQGSHSQLFEMNGTYAGMYRAFSAGLIDGTL